MIYFGFLCHGLCSPDTVQATVIDVEPVGAVEQPENELSAHHLGAAPSPPATGVPSGASLKMPSTNGSRSSGAGRDDSTKYIMFGLAFVAVPMVFAIGAACWMLTACRNRQKRLIGGAEQATAREHKHAVWAA